MQFAHLVLDVILSNATRNWPLKYLSLIPLIRGIKYHHHFHHQSWQVAANVVQYQDNSSCIILFSFLYLPQYLLEISFHIPAAFDL